MARTVFITGDERERRIEQAKTSKWISAFDMINEHNGYREGKLHLFIGPTGAGKSTLTRTLLVDALNSTVKTGEKIGAFLTEESIDEFITEVNFVKLPEHLGTRLIVESEQDLNFRDATEWMLFLKRFVDEHELKILFLDNITTSEFYNDARPEEQGRIVRGLKRLAQVCNIPVIILAHTSSEVTETYPKLINLENIRGSKNLPNMVEFAYIIQPFIHEGERHNFIRIAKHRGQHVKNRLFKFFYYERVKIFGKCEAKSFEGFKELFSKRERL